MEEQVLSQNLSQLSTKDDGDQEQELSSNKKRPLSSPSTPDVASKKIWIVDDKRNKKDQIPEYLQPTNNAFDKIMKDHIINSATTITVEDLRQLAILKHKIAITKLDKDLWTVYFKSGTGQWETLESKTTNVDRRLWPEQIKKLMPPSTQTTIVIDEQNICENIVHEGLQDIDKTIEQYQFDFVEKKKCLIGFTDEMEQAIETFIEQYGDIQSFRMKGNYKITILEYDYDAELLEREYRRLQPTQYEVR